MGRDRPDWPAHEVPRDDASDAEVERIAFTEGDAGEDPGGWWANPRPGRTIAIAVCAVLAALVGLSVGLLAGTTRGSGDPAPTAEAPAPGGGIVTPSRTDPDAPPAAMTTVPDGLVGADLREAMATLAAAGLPFEIRGRSLGGQDGIVDGEVLTTDPRPGTRVATTTVVVVDFATTPPVAGTSPDDAAESTPVLRPGNPAGSGCTPGPGALPDGQWVGYVTSATATELAFDLICYDSATGAVTNERTDVRRVPLADDAQVRCVVALCAPVDLNPAAIAVLHVRGGEVRFVHPVGPPSGAGGAPDDPVPPDERPVEASASELAQLFLDRAVQGHPSPSVATPEAVAAVADSPLFGAGEEGETTVEVDDACPEGAGVAHVCVVTVTSEADLPADRWEVLVDLVDDQLTVTGVRVAEEA